MAEDIDITAFRKSESLRFRVADLEAEILKCRKGIEAAVAKVVSADAEYRVAEAQFRKIRNEADSLEYSLMALRNELEKVRGEGDA